MRVLELYREGGLPEVRRGIADWTAHRGQEVVAAARNPARIYRGAVGNVGTYLGGEHVWTRDWDILCVLDGCRHDTYQNYRNTAIESIESVGSTSQTWIPRTFDNDVIEYASTGYITGNPFSSRLDSDSLAYYHAEGIQETGGVETVPPTPLTEHAIHAWRNRYEFDINRLVVHYMQPHVPFPSRPDWFRDYRDTEEWGSNLWRRINDDIPRSEFMAAYRDTLDWVFAGDGGVTTLLKNVNAKVAVTADHGNAIGEWGFYGHPRGCPVSAVREVPWETFTVADKATRYPDIKEQQSDMNIDEQLEALGYK